VTYSLAFVSSDNGRSPGVGTFARILQNKLIVIESQDTTLVGNYTLNLVGQFEYT